MSRVRVQLYGKQGSAAVDTEATNGARIGLNVWNADGTLYVPAEASAPAAAVSRTMWELVLKIPANITGLAAVSTDGWFRKDAAAIVARELLGSDLPDVAPAAGGTLQRYGFDAKGRRSEEEAATAADLAYDNASSG